MVCEVNRVREQVCRTLRKGFTTVCILLGWRVTFLGPKNWIECFEIFLNLAGFRHGCNILHLIHAVVSLLDCLVDVGADGRDWHVDVYVHFRCAELSPAPSPNAKCLNSCDLTEEVCPKHY